jgi:hypothetical protein
MSIASQRVVVVVVFDLLRFIVNPVGLAAVVHTLLVTVEPAPVNCVNIMIGEPLNAVGNTMSAVVVVFAALGVIETVPVCQVLIPNLT